MDTERYLNLLRPLGLDSASRFREEAYARNIGILTKKEQETLAEKTVGIAGLGGVGGSHLITLVRAGVGRFHLADFDRFDIVNVNRQYGAKVSNLGIAKLEAMTEEALSINPFLQIEGFPEGIAQDDLDRFLTGVDVILDGLDFFAFDIRRELFNRSWDKGIPVITAGPIGFSSAMLVFSPERGLGFDAYFDVYDELPEAEKHLRFFLGLTPKGTHFKYMDTSRIDLSSRKGPSLIVGCQLSSALAATETLRILLRRKGLKAAPAFVQFDAYRHLYRKGRLWRGNRHPVQRIKRWYVKRHVLKMGDLAVTELPSKPEMLPQDGQGIPRDVMEYVVRAGIQAPSGDNAQPWRFVLNQDSIEVFLDHEADHSFFNVDQCASIISCGGGVENMRIASTEFGLSSDVQLVPDQHEPSLMARLTLSMTGEAPSPLAGSIWQRTTNRKKYAKKGVSEEILNGMKHACSSVSGCHLSLLTDRDKLKEMARLVFKVDRIRTEHRPLHEHLMHMIRFTERDMYVHRTGLPLKNLEAGLMGEVFLRLTRPWKVMQAVNSIGLGRMVPFIAYQGVLASAGVALVTVNGRDTAHLLRGGQGLERVWLQASQSGLSIQPMAAIGLFWLRWVLGKKGSFSPGHQQILEEVWPRFQGLFPDSDLEQQTPVMLFRFGKASTIDQRTFRKPLKAFVP